MIRNRFKQPEYDAELGVFSDSTWNTKGGGGGSSETKTEPSPEQRAILRKQLDLANQLEAKGELQFFPGQTLAGQDPLTQVGQAAQLNAANAIGGVNQPAVASLERLLSADLVNDPRTQALADAVTRPLEQQFFEQTLPGISSAATAQGAFGGDREALLKATAARDFTQAVGDTRARVFADALRQGLGAQQGALGLLPSVTEGLLAPSQVIQDVGAQREARSQAEIDAARERFEFEQFAPTDLVNRVSGPLSSLNFGTVTTTKQSGGGK